MESIKFIIIHTGYDNRLTQIYTQNTDINDWDESVEEALDEVCQKYKPVAFPELNYCQDPFILDESLYLQVRELLQRDIDTYRNDIMLKDSAIFVYPSGEKNLYDIVHKLSSVDYCGCFGSIYNMHFRGDGSILVIEMDCESG